MIEEQGIGASALEFELISNRNSVSVLLSTQCWSILIFALVSAQIFMLWVLDWSTKSMLAGLAVGVIILGNICFYCYQSYLSKHRSYLMVDLATLYLFKRGDLHFKQSLNEVEIEPLGDDDSGRSAFSVRVDGEIVFTVGTKTYYSSEAWKPLAQPTFCLVNEQQWPKIREILYAKQELVSSE